MKFQTREKKKKTHIRPGSVDGSEGQVSSWCGLLHRSDQRSQVRSEMNEADDCNAHMQHVVATYKKTKTKTKTKQKQTFFTFKNYQVQ